MFKKGHRWLAALAAGGLACGAAWAEGEVEGIYADVEMEGGGGFTIRLETEKAERAAAAFVGLATGEVGWLDWNGRAMSGRPYYDGRLMHRVVPGVAVQGGAVEGPEVAYDRENNGKMLGWTFSDSFVTTNAPGVTTNEFDPLEVPQPLAAAVEASVEWQGRTWRTVASNHTREVVTLVWQTGRGGTWTTNRATLRDEWVANGRLEEVVRPYTLDNIAWTVANTNGKAEVCTNQWWLYIRFTNQLARPQATGGTNFLSAGFAMPDCATNGLKHVRGAVSMARTLPNTDGAQFFVCAADAPGWDGQYTVFGTVTAGMESVDAMAGTETSSDGNNRPLEDLRIKSVRIRRVGAAAEAWDWRGKGVPEVGGLALRVEKGEDGEMAAVGDIPERCEVTGGTAAGLEEGAWLRVREGYFPTGVTWRAAAEGAGTQGFFAVSAVQYAEDASAVPETVWGRRLWLEWNSPAATEVVQFPAHNSEQGWFARQSGTNVVSGSVLDRRTSWVPARHSAGLVFYTLAQGQLLTRELQLKWEAGEGTNQTFVGVFTPYGGTPGTVTGRFWFEE